MGRVPQEDPHVAQPTPGQGSRPPWPTQLGESMLDLSGGQSQAQPEAVLVCEVGEGAKTPERGYGDSAGLTQVNTPAVSSLLSGRPPSEGCFLQHIFAPHHALQRTLQNL